MYRISKTFTFSAAHYLEGLPPKHQCARLHGHNYTILLVLEAHRLDDVGFVRDYGELGMFKTWLDANFDHNNINDLSQFVGNPTAENLARSIFETASRMYPEVVEVGVSETDKTWAFYRPEAGA